MPDGAAPPAGKTPTSPLSTGARSIIGTRTTRQYAGSVTRTSPLLVAKSPFDSESQSGYGAEIEAAVKAKMEAEFNKLSATARREACNRLKEEYPEQEGIQALDCGTDSFQTILKVVAVAAATAYCGPTCGALAIIAVNIFGRALEDWCAEIREGWESAWEEGGFLIGGSCDDWDKLNNFDRLNCCRESGGQVVTENGKVYCVKDGQRLLIS